MPINAELLHDEDNVSLPKRSIHYRNMLKTVILKMKKLVRWLGWNSTMGEEVERERFGGYGSQAGWSVGFSSGEWCGYDVIGDGFWGRRE